MLLLTKITNFSTVKKVFVLSESLRGSNATFAYATCLTAQSVEILRTSGEAALWSTSSAARHYGGRNIADSSRTLSNVNLEGQSKCEFRALAKPLAAR